MENFKNIPTFFAFFLIGLTFTGCPKKEPIPPQPEKKITSITVKTKLGENLNAVINESSHEIVVGLGVNCALYQDMITVIPEVSEGATVFPAAGSVIDLTWPQKITVTASDGTKQEYTIYLKGGVMWGSHFYLDEETGFCDYWSFSNSSINSLFGITSIRGSTDNSPNENIAVEFAIPGIQLGEFSNNTTVNYPLQWGYNRSNEMIVASGNIYYIDPVKKEFSCYWHTESKGLLSTHSDIADGIFFNMPYQ